MLDGEGESRKGRENRSGQFRMHANPDLGEKNLPLLITCDAHIAHLASDT
jgi:hypothetical protein